MTGWVLRSVRGDQRFRFPEGYILQPGASVFIHSGSAAKHAPPTHIRWTNDFIWNNKEYDPAELYDATGNLIDRKGG